MIIWRKVLPTLKITALKFINVLKSVEKSLFFRCRLDLSYVSLANLVLRKHLKKISIKKRHSNYFLHENSEYRHCYSKRMEQNVFLIFLIR